MSLQINITPLSSNVILAASCAKFFQTVQHYQRTDKNPYDIYVLTTAAGTQIEALFQSESLCLDVSSSDLQDISLGDALFKVAKHGPCAIWSDDAEVVAVTDLQFTETAVEIFEIDEGLVEDFNSGSDLFDLLFGVEPARIDSPSLAQSLIALGFQIDQTNNQRANLKLPEKGIFLDLDPDENFGWQKTEGISLGLANPRFAVVMSGWAPDVSGPLSELGVRKARQDRAGYILWSGHLQFAEFPATAATPVLGIYDHAMPLGILVQRLTQAANSKAFAHDVFGGALAPFVIPMEGLWVFLFLMTEAGLDRVEIFDSYNRLKSEGAMFGTTNHLSLDAIDAYLELHQSRLVKHS